MTREEIIYQLKNFFDVKELVCPHTYAKWGEKSWQFLDTAYLHTLLVIRRDILKVPMTCNDKTVTQRGLRCNMCDIVKSKNTNYLSSHIFGKAGDFVSSQMTAAQMRNEIKKNFAILPYPIRMEANVSWLHFDVLNQYGVTQKVYEFK